MENSDSSIEKQRPELVRPQEQAHELKDMSRVQMKELIAGQEVLINTLREQLEEQDDKLANVKSAEIEELKQELSRQKVMNQRLLDELQEFRQKTQKPCTYLEKMRALGDHLGIPSQKLREEHADLVMAQALDELEARNVLVAKTEQELKRRGQEANQLQDACKQQLQMQQKEFTKEIATRDAQIKQLQEKMQGQQKLLQDAERIRKEHGADVQAVEQKFKDLQSLCVQQQDMLQILEVENIVALAQLQGKPMDICEEALKDGFQWMHAEKQLGSYITDFQQYKAWKDALLAPPKEQSPQPQVTLKLKEEAAPSQKISRSQVRTKQSRVSFLPIPPDTEIAKKVDELKKQMNSEGIELPLEWKRLENQPDNDNIWQWHIGGKSIQIDIVRNKLMVRVGGGQIGLIEYIANFLE